MKQRVRGLITTLLIMAWPVVGWTQTNLIVVRHADNTLWKMTCDGTVDCSPWTKIGGLFSVQPTLTWDPAINKYILIGIGNNLSNIWRSTFEADGTWNNDWTLIATGATGSPSPVAASAVVDLTDIYTELDSVKNRLSTAEDMLLKLNKIAQIKFVFLSSQDYNGNLGGLDGADGICNSLASNAGLPGTYKSWLSNNSTGPIDRFNRFYNYYVLATNDVIAFDWTDLTNGDILRSINVTENKQVRLRPPQGNPLYVWTNTLSTGELKTSVWNCSEWTSASHSLYGSLGRSDGTQDSSQHGWSDCQTIDYCDLPKPIYCFQQ